MTVDLDKARAELREKSKADVDAETADTWAARAIAAYELACAETSLTKRVRWLMDAEGYEQEAKEHAAGCGPQKLEEIINVLVECKKQIRGGT